MRKWGHVEGSGLGARGEGIVHALTTEHVAPITNLSQPQSKRALAKQKAAAANAKSRKWVQAPSARGRIVNENKDERAKEEKQRMGEEGRVICLRGLVGSVEEIDEELVNEIGEECSNYGIVERVVLHLVEPPPPEPEECLRVFVVFSGMAGAWRAVKELDGRFFGGRNIVSIHCHWRRDSTQTRIRKPRISTRPDSTKEIEMVQCFSFFGDVPRCIEYYFACVHALDVKIYQLEFLTANSLGVHRCKTIHRRPQQHPMILQMLSQCLHLPDVFNQLSDRDGTWGEQRRDLKTTESHHIHGPGRLLRTANE